MIEPSASVEPVASTVTSRFWVDDVKAAMGNAFAADTTTVDVPVAVPPALSVTVRVTS